MVKNLPAMRETWVQSLGWEDSLEEGMATHSSILAWRIPWAEKPDRSQNQTLLSSTRARVHTHTPTHTHPHTHTHTHTWGQQEAAEGSRLQVPLLAPRHD